MPITINPKELLWNRYVEWIIDTIFEGYGNENTKHMYSLLLEDLAKTQYRWILNEDHNRYIDGLDLRRRYAWVTGIDEKYVLCQLREYDCSLLEMMAALAIRCEEIMSDPEQGLRIHIWFRKMLSSLHLDMMTDDNYNYQYVQDREMIFLTQSYDSDGDGGLFYIPNETRDLREKEIWCQMCWWLASENY